ncbi:MAG: hypothetical protein AB1670_17405 [Pseudomonadota bacterium]
MRILIAMGISLVLAGCANYQAQLAEQVASAADAQCRSYGAQPGSPAYIQCRMNIDNQRANERSAALARLNPPPPQTVNVNVCQPTPGQVDWCMYR